VHFGPRVGLDALPQPRGEVTLRKLPFGKREHRDVFLLVGRNELRAVQLDECSIPCRDARELTLDVLRHGAHVEVIEPEALKSAITEELERALALYRPR